MEHITCGITISIVAGAFFYLMRKSLSLIEALRQEQRRAERLMRELDALHHDFASLAFGKWRHLSEEVKKEKRKR